MPRRGRWPLADRRLPRGPLPWRRQPDTRGRRRQPAATAAGRGQAGERHEHRHAEREAVRQLGQLVLGEGGRVLSPVVRMGPLPILDCLLNGGYKFNIMKSKTEVLTMV